jgi:two-component system chemotaxis sensor kinase CheA
LRRGASAEERKSESENSKNKESSPIDDSWNPLTLNPAEIAKAKSALKGGKKAWRFKFTPVPGLAERGINVTKLRDRLQATGELIYSSPRVLATGGIVFDFVIVTDAPESTFATWVNDGLTYIPYTEVEEELPLREREKEREREVEEVIPVEPSSPVAVSQEKKQVSAVAVENGSKGSGTPAEIVTPTLVQPVTKEGEGEGMGLGKKISSPSPSSVVPAAAVTAAAPSNMVRVDLTRLDELMRMVGDLVISKARLEDNLSKLETIVPAPQLRVLRETSMTLSSQLRDLREGVMQVRLVPIREIFARMQFVVRDIARESHKKVTLELSGQETEIDKFVVERMMDPLLHLVRNAVSHGLESESERIAQGKPPVGKLALRAATVGETVVIEIEDDGRGVDLEKVAARARSLGLIGADAALDMNAALDVICSAGFSTREVADLTSGRGVGMAVVKTTVQELGGTLTLESKLGVSTRFTIQLPLTLAIADALIVRVGGQTFAVPLSTVREVFHVESEQVTVLENNEIIAYRGGVLPLLRLERLFKLSKAESTRQVVLVVGNGLAACGVVVERILDQREIVVRTLRDPLVQVVGISGATELGDGRVVLILDAAQLPNFPRQHSRSHKNSGAKSAISLVGNGQVRSGAIK